MTDDGQATSARKSRGISWRRCRHSSSSSGGGGNDDVGGGGGSKAVNTGLFSGTSGGAQDDEAAKLAGKNPRWLAAQEKNRQAEDIRERIGRLLDDIDAEEAKEPPLEPVLKRSWLKTRRLELRKVSMKSADEVAASESFVAKVEQKLQEAREGSDCGSGKAGKEKSKKKKKENKEKEKKKKKKRESQDSDSDSEADADVKEEEDAGEEDNGEREDPHGEDDEVEQSRSKQRRSRRIGGLTDSGRGDGQDQTPSPPSERGSSAKDGGSGSGDRDSGKQLDKGKKKDRGKKEEERKKRKSDNGQRADSGSDGERSESENEAGKHKWKKPLKKLPIIRLPKKKKSSGGGGIEKASPDSPALADSSRSWGERVDTPKDLAAGRPLRRLSVGSASDAAASASLSSSEEDEDDAEENVIIVLDVEPGAVSDGSVNEVALKEQELPVGGRKKKQKKEKKKEKKPKATAAAASAERKDSETIEDIPVLQEESSVRKKLREKFSIRRKPKRSDDAEEPADEPDDSSSGDADAKGKKKKKKASRSKAGVDAVDNNRDGPRSPIRAVDDDSIRCISLD